MSNCWQCDRCKNVKTGTYEPRFVMKYGTLDVMSNMISLDSINVFDLCTECKEKLDAFMKREHK